LVAFVNSRVAPNEKLSTLPSPRHSLPNFQPFRTSSAIII